MKIVLFSLLLAALAANAAWAVPLSDFPEQEYSRFVQYTDENGLQKTIDLEEEVDEDLLDSLDSYIDRCVLFTRENPSEGQNLEMNNVESILSSNFDPNAPTVVVVHGWLGNQDSGMNTQVREAFLSKGPANVIAVDWRSLAVSGYVTATRGVPEAGRQLGRFLAFLNKVANAPYEKMHLVGFSLGAHLVGNAGRELGGKVARVTGLDPAGLLWNLNSNKISRNDGQYVEGIHTDGGLSASIGIGYAIGDADFFPNGGNSQPGCLTNFCNHNRAWRFFASTITHDHLVGRQCSNYLQVTLGTCRGQNLNMGNSDLNKTGSGLYRMRTRRFYPY
ncbi:pancreatic lipase-related protein 2-like [Ostrinia furnacalis]|uniref:pancreatic lipase-related protein 2-like n=1 Tax=Ostrinia furnacalis TaxID=93504 RepID=UPI00103DE6D2|nr:pancreatic lipase-related protein 2-like [Ostrinia furnacalis]